MHFFDRLSAKLHSLHNLLARKLRSLHDLLSRKVQTLRHTLYYRKYRHLYKLGVERRLIAAYSEDFIELMRGFSHHGILASIIFLSGLATRHHCHGTAILMANILTVSGVPFTLKKVSLEGLRIDPKILSHRDRLAASWHYIIEIADPDGTRWIVDPTMGLIYRKWLYWLMDLPRTLEVVDPANLPELTLNHEYCPIEDCHARRLAVPILISSILDAMQDNPLLPYEYPDALINRSSAPTAQLSDSDPTASDAPDEPKPKTRLEEEIKLFISTPEFQATDAEARALLKKQLEIDPNYLDDTTRSYDPNNLLDKVSVEVSNFWSIRKPPKPSEPSPDQPTAHP